MLKISSQFVEDANGKRFRAFVAVSSLILSQP